MKKLIILMIMSGLVGISACASNEANMESAGNDAEMAKDKSDAAMADAKAKAEEAEDDAKAKAEAAAAKAKADAEEAEESVMATGGSDNKVSVCKNGENVRTITVVYNDESSENTCQVDYEKSSGVQTLWTAITDKDYCLEKAEGFVTKQEGWGWTCSALQ
jgi:hypothetical protein